MTIDEDQVKQVNCNYFFVAFSFDNNFRTHVILEKKMEGSSKEKPQLKIGHYVLGKNLGAGTFGKVKGENNF